MKTRRLRRQKSKLTRRRLANRITRLPRVESLEYRRLLVVGFAEVPPVVVPGTGFDGVVSLNGSSCTGSLMETGRHILTAAHCFDFGQDPRGNARQTLTIQGAPTGGTFTLGFAGATTGGIAFNANAAQIEAAIDALATISFQKTS